jgi:DNA polymerase III delta subunit
MPLTVITGDDTYRVERALKALRADAVDPIMGTLGQSRLFNPALPDAVEALATMTLSLGGGMPLVEIHGGWWLEKAAQTKAEEAGVAQLQTALTDASERQTIVILAEKPNGRLKFVKWLTTPAKSGARVLAFEVPPPWKADEVVSLLMAEAQQNGHAIQPAAARLLVDSYGHALQPLMTEVAKLATYTGGKPIGVADVQALCQSGERMQVLLERWVQQTEGVDQRLHHLAELLLKQHPLPLFATLTGYLEYAHQVRHGGQVHRMTPEALTTQTGKNAYRIKKELEGGLANVPLARLQALRRKALACEVALKTGALDAQLALEELLCF